MLRHDIDQVWFPSYSKRWALNCQNCAVGLILPLNFHWQWSSVLGGLITPLLSRTKIIDNFLWGKKYSKDNTALHECPKIKYLPPDSKP